MSLVSMAIGTGLSRAQDESKGAAEKPAGKKDEVKGRLPIYFGQIGLSKKQEDEVRKAALPFDLKITELRKQISDLEKQIDELDAEKATACEEVLTEGQKSALKARREQAETERAARKKTPKSAQNTPPDPSTKK